MNITQIPKIVLFQFLLYFLAGINHFVNPQFYLKLIPPYIPFHKAVNIISGIAEITLSLLLLYLPTRKAASFLVLVMLTLFIPVHFYYIKVNSCQEAPLCLLFWIGWTRLIIIHPLLMVCAWEARKAT